MINLSLPCYQCSTSLSSPSNKILIIHWLIQKTRIFYICKIPLRTFFYLCSFQAELVFNQQAIEIGPLDGTWFKDLNETFWGSEVYKNSLPCSTSVRQIRSDFSCIKVMHLRNLNFKKDKFDKSRQTKFRIWIWCVRRKVHEFNGRNWLPGTKFNHRSCYFRI